MQNGFIMFCIAGAIMLGSCATSKTAAMLDSRLGVMTYNDAVEQFGQPMECTDGENTRRCTWIRWRGRRFKPDSGVVQMTVAADPPVALLTFTDGVLTDWHLSGKWH